MGKNFLFTEEKHRVREVVCQMKMDSALWLINMIRTQRVGLGELKSIVISPDWLFLADSFQNPVVSIHNPEEKYYGFDSPPYPGEYEDFIRSTY